ncbi:DUF4352 domain-containing protein [Sphaerimonospora sp. CA-214678]|uniref:DUF4352 domain-containing protein n=1 Tax=Sphaerimonospora sp. CA-214678 TaxID=3240029 RepID=UPI003D903594
MMAVTQPETSRPARHSAETHRRPPGKRRLGARVAAAVVGVALAAAAVYAQTFALSAEQRSSLITVNGRIGEVVDTHRFSVRVSSMTAALAVDTTDYGDQVTKVGTSNLFLVADISITTAHEPMRLSPGPNVVLLTRDGRRYQTTDKVNQSLTAFNRHYQPGFWSSGVLVFEVPKDAVSGARLVIAPPTGFITDYSAPEAEIDLGLSGETARRFIAQAEDYHSLVSNKR